MQSDNALIINNDIEDFVSSISPAADSNFLSVKIKSKRQNKEEELIIDEKCASVLPWTKSIYLKTWGCSHNTSDSEHMAGLLFKAGFKLSDDKDSADLWLLNSCTVKTPSENQLENVIADGKRKGKYLVIAGCIPQASPSTRWIKDVSLIGVNQISNTVKVIEETLSGSTVRLLSKRKSDGSNLNLPKIRRNKFIEILAINSGCLNHCTYCKTKMARGDLRSFSLNDLVERAKSAFFNDGVKELWLTSEDVGAWGRDISLNIVDLLNSLLDVIPNGCKMRIGMTNPPYILDHIEEIAEILLNPKVYKFLHIPVQSGSNAVLSDMKREYSVEQFCRIVDYLKSRIPGIYIATDFICAFPTETSEDFEESLELVQKYKFPSLFINQFYPRPATPAARLPKILSHEAKRRTAAMTKLFYSYQRYTEERVGEIWEVLICEMATDGKSYVGHNEYYEHFLVPQLDDDDGKVGSLLGQNVRVKITSVSKFYMKADVVFSESKLPEKSRSKPAFLFLIHIVILFFAITAYFVSRIYVFS